MSQHSKKILRDKGKCLFLFVGFLTVALIVAFVWIHYWRIVKIILGPLLGTRGMFD